MRSNMLVLGSVLSLVACVAHATEPNVDVGSFSGGRVVANLEAEPLGKFKTKEPSGEIFTSLKYGTIQFVTGAVTDVNIVRASHGEQMIIVDD